MDSLFNTDARYTQIAMEIDEAANIALQAIFERYVKQGYSPREIGHIVHLAVLDLELDAVMKVGEQHGKERSHG